MSSKTTATKENALSKSEIDLNTEENIIKNCYEIYEKLNANDTNF